MGRSAFSRVERSPRLAAVARFPIACHLPLLPHEGQQVHLRRIRMLFHHPCQVLAEPVSFR